LNRLKSANHRLRDYGEKRANVFYSVIPLNLKPINTFQIKLKLGFRFKVIYNYSPIIAEVVQDYIFKIPRSTYLDRQLEVFRDKASNDLPVMSAWKHIQEGAIRNLKHILF
jgi:hypothetical protein